MGATLPEPRSRMRNSRGGPAGAAAVRFRPAPATLPHDPSTCSAGAARGRAAAMREWSVHGSARPSRPGRAVAGGAPAGVGGRAPLAAGGAVVGGAPPPAGGGLRPALAPAARSRPDRALQGVPAPEAQDAG